MKRGSNRACLSDTCLRATGRQTSGLTEQTYRGERNRKAQQQDVLVRGCPIAAPSLKGRPNLRCLSASRPLARSSVVPRAFAAATVEDIASDVNELRKHIEAEVVLESGLHVPAVAAGGCYQRFGLPVEVAPPLVKPLEAHDPTPSEESEKAVGLAMCLATPSDDEARGNMREAMTRALDDMARQRETGVEIQNILNTVEELELGSQRDMASRAPSRPTRRPSKSVDAIEFDAETVESDERGVEGNIVELTVNSFRRRPVEAD